jgi:hypothetical protein
MIPTMNIVAWGRTVPWVEPRQVEQDLVIARTLVEIFSDDFLRKELRFRGGTALNKLHFSKPFRYSEDIDLTRTTVPFPARALRKQRQTGAPWGSRYFLRGRMKRAAPRQIAARFTKVRSGVAGRAQLHSIGCGGEEASTAPGC